MKRFGDLSNFLNDERRWSVVVTNYQDFYKIVCEYIKYMRPEVNTTEEAEKYIKENNGKELILAKYHMGKKDFAEGKYVCNDASAVANAIC